MEEGVNTSSCSGSTIWWSGHRESWLLHEKVELEVEYAVAERGNFCRLAGVLGGVGTGQISLVGGTGKTTGAAQSESLLMSMTWIGAEWLRRFTWYFF